MLSITPGMKLKTTIGPKSEELNVPLSLGKWTTIYVSYVLTAEGFGISRVFLNGGDAGGNAATMNGNLRSDFSLSDTLQIGGDFVGSIRRLQIYTTAALELVTGTELCSPSTCSVETGFGAVYCLQAVCTIAGTYPSFTSCESCPSICATCSDPSTCLSCKTGLYLSGTTCLSIILIWKEGDK